MSCSVAASEFTNPLWKIHSLPPPDLWFIVEVCVLSDLAAHFFSWRIHKEPENGRTSYCQVEKVKGPQPTVWVLWTRKTVSPLTLAYKLQHCPIKKKWPHPQSHTSTASHVAPPSSQRSGAPAPVWLLARLMPFFLSLCVSVSVSLPLSFSAKLEAVTLFAELQHWQAEAPPAGLQVLISSDSFISFTLGGGKACFLKQIAERALCS